MTKLQGIELFGLVLSLISIAAGIGCTWLYIVLPRNYKAWAIALWCVYLGGFLTIANYVIDYIMNVLVTVS